MPKKFPPEFKRDVVTVARRGALTVAEVAADFDISPESVRRWMRQADIDDGVRDGLSTAEQAEVALMGSPDSGPPVVRVRQPRIWAWRTQHDEATPAHARAGGAQAP